MTVLLSTDSFADAFVTAALEVYVRRAYRAYSILSLDYDEGDDVGELDAFQAVTWRFKLGQSRSPPQTPRLAD